MITLEQQPRPETQESKNAFIRKLEAQWAKGNFVCVGLDTDFSQIPQHLKDEAYVGDPIQSAMFKFNRMVVDATHDLVCAYKPNIAFYEAQGESGFRALKDTVGYIKRYYPDIPVIVDAKRADIGSTNNGYVEAIFDKLGADAVTVNPYFGGEALSPFLDRKDKGVIVLVRTSNPGARELQGLPVSLEGLQDQDPILMSNLIDALEVDAETDTVPLYRVVAFLASKRWNGNGNVSVVVGATAPEELASVRKIVGDVPILIPGVGAQGGDLEKAVRAGGSRIILNSSRGIIFASKGEDFPQAARKATEKLRDEINRYIVPENPEGLTTEQEKLVDMLYTTKTEAKVNKRKTLPDGSYNFYSIVRPTAPVDFAQDDEEFVLKLHEKTPDAPLSPYYVNLRNLPEELKRQIAIVLDEMDPGLNVDFVSGIPQAGTPLAEAYSQLTKTPHIEIFEKEVTADGRRIVPGAIGSLEGKTALIVDDLVTKGGSKEETIEAARQLGIETVIRVVVDRQQGGLEELKSKGFDINAAITWNQIMEYGRRKGHITEEQYKRAKDYLASQK